MPTVWDSIQGQPRVVQQLRNVVTTPVHAYLFVGPDGCGKEEAALAFAGRILSGVDDVTDRVNDMALRGVHPDIHEIRRDGASILKGQAEEVIRIASITPTESARKVIIMHEVHLMQPSAAASLLKTVEEPPPGVYFIMLSEQIDDTLITIASRCLTVHFAALSSEVLEQILSDDGIDPTTARTAAKSAHGSITRARLLASDQQLGKRREFFANIPRRIDGTGATAAAIAEQIISLVDEATEPLERQHEQELADLEQTLAVMGVKRGGKKPVEERQKRELRRHRTDELRDGLTEIAAVYRDELTRATSIHRPEAYVVAIERIHEAMRRLSLNINETIMLRDLIWSLPSPSADAALQFVLAEGTE